MDIENRVCKILGIKYPVIQGAMQWISDSSLVAAVSQAGGLGVLATADMDKEFIRSEIRKIRSLTDKPFAVNIAMLSKTVKETFEVATEEKVPFVVTAAGNPAPYLPMLQEAEVPFFSVVATVKQAVKMEQMGACLIVAEGQESGGHIGEMTSMALIPQVASGIKVPIVAAGGIADGRGMAAAFMLGAEGIQMGTIFLTSNECSAHKDFKQAIVSADSGNVVVTGRRIYSAVRCLDNDLTKSLRELDDRCAKKEEYYELSVGASYRAAREGDLINGSIMAGQIVGLVDCEQSVSNIIQNIVSGYNNLRLCLPELPS